MSDMFKTSPPPPEVLQFQSVPAGATVQTAQGQTCSTPCSLARAGKRPGCFILAFRLCAANGSARGAPGPKARYSANRRPIWCPIPSWRSSKPCRHRRHAKSSNRGRASRSPDPGQQPRGRLRVGADPTFDRRSRAGGTGAGQRLPSAAADISLPLPAAAADAVTAERGAGAFPKGSGLLRALSGTFD